MVSHLNKNIVACGFYSRESGIFHCDMVQQQANFCVLHKKHATIATRALPPCPKIHNKVQFLGFLRVQYFPQIGIIIQHLKKISNRAILHTVKNLEKMT